MKFATVGTIFALLAAAQACGIKSCSDYNGQGRCTAVKDQNDGGCHGNGEVIRSFVWEGNCSGSGKVLCSWDNVPCNGKRSAEQNVGSPPQNGIRNINSQRKSWKFMNSSFC